MRTFAGLVGAMLLVSSTSSAEEAPSFELAFDPSAVYVGIGMSVGQEFVRAIPGTRSFTTGVGVDAWAGYRLTSYLAFEIECEYIDHFNSGDIELAALTATANLRLYLNRGRFHPFVLGGAGAGNWVTHLPGRGAMDIAFAMRFGAGMDYDLTPNVALVAKAGYVLMYSNLDDFDYASVTLGAQYRF